MYVTECMSVCVYDCVPACARLCENVCIQGDCVYSMTECVTVWLLVCVCITVTV